MDRAPSFGTRRYVYGLDGAGLVLLGGLLLPGPPPGAGVLGALVGDTFTVVGAGLTLMLVVLLLAPMLRSGPVNRYHAMIARTTNTINTVIRLMPAAAVRSALVSTGSVPGGLTLI